VADTDGCRLLAWSFGIARLTAATMPMARTTAGAIGATAAAGLVAGLVAGASAGARSVFP
jgi:hypothetical protein